MGCELLRLGPPVYNRNETRGSLIYILQTEHNALTSGQSSPLASGLLKIKRKNKQHTHTHTKEYDTHEHSEDRVWLDIHCVKFTSADVNTGEYIVPTLRLQALLSAYFI
jgi:hypothetical protein